MSTQAQFALNLAAAKSECLDRLLAIARGSTNETQARLAATAILRYRPDPIEEQEDIDDIDEELDEQIEEDDEVEDDDTNPEPATHTRRPANPLLTADELAELRRRSPHRSESQLRDPALAAYWRDELQLARSREPAAPTAASPPAADRAA